MRVRDTPISEQAIVGTAIGAAVAGLRPVGEIMFADFAGVCYDQIANQLAKFRFHERRPGDRAGHAADGRRRQAAASAPSTRSASRTGSSNVPGLKLCVPATPGDVYTLLRAAIRDDDPVLVFEHKALYSVKGELPDGAGLPIGRAEIVRSGSDVTVVAPS